MGEHGSPPPVSQRFMEAFARGELTKGGMAEAGWFELGTLVGDSLRRKVDRLTIVLAQGGERE